MFRFFLKKKISADSENPLQDVLQDASLTLASALHSPLATSTKPAESNVSQTRNQLRDAARNRRSRQRFTVEHKHLTLMNDQDILLIRELSADGFCAQVSERGYHRLNIDDRYEGRIRYLANIFDLQVRVVWKEGGLIGFAIEEADANTRSLIERLLKPIEVAESFAEVDTPALRDAGREQGGKLWYHGDHETDLFVWLDASGAMTGWEFQSEGQFVEWDRDRGFQTGDLEAALGGGGARACAFERERRPDPVPDLSKQRFAVDVLMAVQLPIRDLLLPTLQEQR